MAEKLMVVEQKEVLFYEDTIVAVRLEDGAVYVPIRPICDNLGVALAGQRERINRDAVLSEVVASVSVTLTQQAREMLCLPLKYIPGWLFGINANRIKEELRDRVVRYQRECFDVLSEAFMEGRLTADPVLDELLQQDTEAVQAYKMLQAMARLARNQVLLEAKLQQHDNTLQEFGSRIGALEASLGDEERYLSQEQASRLSQAVRGIGLLLTKQSGTSEYGRVYGELYRKFEISAYRELPAAKYEEAMGWLNEWRQSLVEDVAF